MNYIYYPDELYHHGIKDQKWGVRRFQNPDGTLTPEGVKRYRKAWSKIQKDQKGFDKAVTTAVMTKPRTGKDKESHEKWLNSLSPSERKRQEKLTNTLDKDYNKAIKKMSKYLGDTEQAESFVNNYKDNNYQDMLKKYDPMKKVSESAVDDYIKYYNGVVDGDNDSIDAKTFNKKYKNTGFKIRP